MPRPTDPMRRWSRRWGMTSSSPSPRRFSPASWGSRRASSSACGSTRRPAPRHLSRRRLPWPDLSAWIEVQSAEEEWIPVDVTPQHTVPIDGEARRQRDPENVTEVRPETAEEVVAPDPVQREPERTTPTTTPPADLSALWASLRVAGLAALVWRWRSAVPVVIAAKAMRRRSRRGLADVSDRVVGGWDEYVDAAVDHGLPAPDAETRTELAHRYATPAGAALAEKADRAVYSGERPRTTRPPRSGPSSTKSVDDSAARPRCGAAGRRRIVEVVRALRRAEPRARTRPSAARSERRMRRLSGSAARTS